MMTGYLRAIAVSVLCCCVSQSYGAEAPTSRPASADFTVARAIEQAYDAGDAGSQILARVLVMYRSAAEDGHVGAMYRLGVCYHFGKGVDPQIAEARRWYELAAWQGHRRAIELTTDYLVDEALGSSGDAQVRAAKLLKDKCVPALRKLKSLGVAEGKLGYAFCQEFGLGGLEEDPAAALACYRESAKAGHERAIYELFGCYAGGRCGLKEDIAQSAAYLEAAAKAGYPEAQYDFAILSFTGQCGVKQDQAIVMPLLIKAAESGVLKAIGTLAWMLHEGVGCKIDIDAAIVWARRGARMGDSESHSVLGQCYLNGLGGLKRDQFQAVQHFLQAEKTAKAWMLLGKCFQDGTGVDADQSEAVAWFTKAANADNSEAQYLLGAGYDRGAFGLPKDPAKAVHWYIQAARGGRNDAQKRLKELGVSWEK